MRNMRKFGILALVILVGAGAAAAQKNKDQPQVVEPGSQRSTRNAPAPSLRSGTRIQAELEKTIDARSAKVGDEVVLKATSNVKQNGEVVVAKGTRILGRVTEVANRSKGSGSSKIGVVFDRIEGKRLASNITASIISITEASSAARLDDVFVAGASVQTSTRSSASASSGGGVLGGVGGTVGGLVDTTARTAGGVVDTGTRTIGSGTGTVGRTVSRLQIENSASGSASGSTTLSAVGRNVRLEKGANFNLLISGSK